MSFQIQTATLRSNKRWSTERRRRLQPQAQQLAVVVALAAAAQSGAASERSTVARSEALEALAEPSWIRVAVAKP